MHIVARLVIRGGGLNGIRYRAVMIRHGGGLRVAVVIIGIGRFCAQRGDAVQQQVLLFLFIISAPVVHRLLRVGAPGRAVRRQVIEIVIGAVFQLSPQRPCRDPVATAVIPVFRPELLRIQIQPAEPRCVHLAIIFHHHLYPVVVHRRLRTSAPELPVVPLLVEVHGPACLPRPAVELHRDPAADIGFAVHLLGKGLGPAAEAETVSGAAVGAELLVERDGPVGMPVQLDHPPRHVLRRVHRRQAVNAHEAVGNAALLAPALRQDPRPACEVAVMQHVIVVAGQSRFQLHAVEPGASGGVLRAQAAGDRLIRRDRERHRLPRELHIRCDGGGIALHGHGVLPVQVGDPQDRFGAPGAHIGAQCVFSGGQRCRLAHICFLICRDGDLLRYQPELVIRLIPDEGARAALHPAAAAILEGRILQQVGHHFFGPGHAGGMVGRSVVLIGGIFGKAQLIIHADRIAPVVEMIPHGLAAVGVRHAGHMVFIAIRGIAAVQLAVVLILRGEYRGLRHRVRQSARHLEIAVGVFGPRAVRRLRRRQQAEPAHGHIFIAALLVILMGDARQLSVRIRKARAGFGLLPRCADGGQQAVLVVKRGHSPAAVSHGGDLHTDGRDSNLIPDGVRQR